MRPPPNPPTSWQKRNRTVASTLSLSIPECTSPVPVPSLARFSEPPSSRVDIHAHSQPNDQVRTPSTSSTQSLPGPATPDVTDIPSNNTVIKSWGRDKVLPPLPVSRAPSMASMRPMESLSDMKSRALGGPSSTRPISSGSELSDSAGIPPLTPKIPHGYTASTHTSTRTTPRPLQLSAFGTGLQPGEPASKQGLLLSYNRQLHDQQRGRVHSGPSPLTSSGHRYSVRPPGSPVTSSVPRSGSVDLSASEMGELRLRPRIGTGMVYKKSSTSLTRAAADVQAQSRIRST
ncbi:hypothetical protein BGW80DRAFT_177693 [Lactifluus volemus]|nr:hypothetical protein BGW80DRAFT_177693 [Lactifluus volemus]